MAENIYNEIADENEIVEPSEKNTEKENEEVETDETSKEVPVLTKEDVEEMGLGKGFIGKPITILKDVYKNQDKIFRQNTQALSELKKEFAEFKDLSKKDIKEAKAEAEEKAEDQLGEMPDPVDDFEAYKAWMAKKDILTEKNFEKILTKVLEEKLSGITQSTAELKADKNTQIYYDNMEAELKEIYKDEYSPELIDKVSREFEEYLKSLDEDEQKIIGDRLQMKPTAIVREAILHHKANLFSKGRSEKKDKTETEEEKKARIAAEQKKKVETLKKTDKKHTDGTSSFREKSKSDEKSVYEQIAEENEVIAKSEGRVS